MSASCQRPTRPQNVTLSLDAGEDSKAGTENGITTDYHGLPGFGRSFPGNESKYLPSGYVT